MNVRRRLLLVMLAFLVGCTGARDGGSIPRASIDGTRHPSATLAPPTPEPTTCPKDLAKRLRRNAVVGEAHSIVPGNPVALVLCGPRARVEMTTAAAVGRFADALNRLKRVPAGEVFACPLDFGPTYGLFFDYDNGAVLLVTADASGCRLASNGRSSAWLTQAMLTRIRHLLRRD